MRESDKLFRINFKQKVFLQNNFVFEKRNFASLNWISIKQLQFTFLGQVISRFREKGGTAIKH